MYVALGEKDLWSALWQGTCRYSETGLALAYQQQGCTEAAQSVYEKVSILLLTHYRHVARGGGGGLDFPLLRNINVLPGPRSARCCTCKVVSFRAHGQKWIEFFAPSNLHLSDIQCHLVHATCNDRRLGIVGIKWLDGTTSVFREYSLQGKCPYR